MRYIITVLLFASQVSLSNGQTKKIQYLTDVTCNVTSFKYRCELGKSDHVDKFTEMSIETARQNGKSLSFTFHVWTNCGHTEKGRVLVINDTLEISDNLKKEDFIRTTYIDSLGQEVVEESYDQTPTTCSCPSTYEYKIRDIKKAIRVICFQNECVSLK